MWGQYQNNKFFRRTDTGSGSRGTDFQRCKREEKEHFSETVHNVETKSKNIRFCSEALLHKSPRLRLLFREWTEGNFHIPAAEASRARLRDYQLYPPLAKLLYNSCSTIFNWICSLHLATSNCIDKSKAWRIGSLASEFYSKTNVYKKNTQ